MCLMIESMGDRRWLEVEARERVELDLEKVDLMLIADRENIYIAMPSKRPQSLQLILPAEARKFSSTKSGGCLGNIRDHI